MRTETLNWTPGTKSSGEKVAVKGYVCPAIRGRIAAQGDIPKIALIYSAQLILVVKPRQCRLQHGLTTWAPSGFVQPVLKSMLP